ncbi:MAG: class I SAM-dependent methyltransferase [Rhodoferax sp.]|uniref:class I SAM-dependent methyltransferase n=1 Tax=Rhodoferax sp. TaxID=50421 RepID=UPI0026283199|nr:class I SAM-dependent methyltransferase [Rhodoferax sp.]MDD2882218.1 class I SAM-dependent methyltransferase [Rhodoferax sp.]
MTDWTAGYVADIGYTFGYYPELNPLRARLAFLNAGLVPPENGTHCELGYGQGLSTNIHAAASGGAWHATDFNPTQAAFAQSLAAVSGSNAHLTDEAFADFCTRTDLPEFDSIGLHGIWSWISDENRAVIVDFIRRKLKVGGVLYISYNTQPGWAPIVPMRDLLTEHSEVMGVAGQGIVSRIDGALAFADKLFATNPTYAKANPWAIERLKGIKGQDRNYLAHEYFNRDWLPMSFASMAQWLTPAKINYACSAHYLDHIDGVNLTAEQQDFLKEIPDAMFRQTVRDFMVNQQFRRDYWVKGLRTLNTLEQTEAFRAQKVVLVQARSDVSLKVTGAIGEATMQEPVYNPILDVLADHKPKTLGQIEQAVKDKGVTFAQVTQAAMILTGAGHLAAVQDEALIPKAKKHTDKLNVHLIDKARGSADISYLASPVTGGGFTVNRFQQLFLLAISQGKKQPAEWASFVWQNLAAQGQKIVKSGKTLETPEDNIAELTVQATAFMTKQLPILKALQIA